MRKALTTLFLVASASGAFFSVAHAAGVKPAPQKAAADAGVDPKDGTRLFMQQRAAAREAAKAAAKERDAIYTKKDCVRRRKNSDEKSCQRKVPQFTFNASAPEKTVVVTVPPLLRFQAKEAVGTGCEPVACVVRAGANPDE